MTRPSPPVADDEVVTRSPIALAIMGALDLSEELKEDMWADGQFDNAARAALAASDREVLVEKVEQEISAWAFAYDIDGAIRNELFARIRAALIPLAGGV